MRNFTLRKGFLESKCGTRSSFKGSCCDDAYDGKFCDGTRSQI